MTICHKACVMTDDWLRKVSVAVTLMDLVGYFMTYLTAVSIGPDEKAIEHSSQNLFW